MKIFKFVKDEEEFLIKNCNFTDDELKIFKMKQKNKSIVAIAMETNMSERNVNNIVNDIVDKIIRALIIRAIKLDK